MIDTDKYEGHTEGPWEWWNDYIRDTFGDEIAKMGYDYILADAELIADAPLLLAEVKRLQYCLRYVGVSMYLEANDYRPYDYGELLEYIMKNVGEPNDLSGEMGVMIQEMIE